MSKKAALANHNSTGVVISTARLEKKKILVPIFIVFFFIIFQTVKQLHVKFKKRKSQLSD